MAKLDGIEKSDWEVNKKQIKDAPTIHHRGAMM